MMLERILKGALVAAAAVALCRRRRSGAAEDHLDRHRRHRRRLLSARRRHGERADEVPAGRSGDGRGHRRLGRQPQAHRLRPERDRLHHGGRGARRPQGPGQVQERQGAAAEPARALSEPHARGDDRGHRRREDRRPQGQARLDRLAGQRHRGHGVQGHRGRRPRQGQGHEARAAVASPRASTPSRTARSTPSSGSAASRRPPSPTLRRRPASR